MAPSEFILNLRAAMAQTLEASDFTSAQRRIEALRPVDPTTSDSVVQEDAKVSPLTAAASESDSARSPSPVYSQQPDRCLAPLPIDELRDPVGPHQSQTTSRCSDKGFLPMTVEDYLELLDWTARQTVAGKHGTTPESALPILERLSLSPATWCELVSEFGSLFFHVAGDLRVVDSARSRICHRRFRVRRQARDLLTDFA